MKKKITTFVTMGEKIIMFLDFIKNVENVI